MTPHGALENMARIEALFGDNLKDAFIPDLFGHFKEFLGHAVHFDYGQAVPAEEHQEFGNQLFDKKLFRLPFPVTFMTASALPKTGIMAIQETEESRFRIHMVTFAPMNIGGDILIDGAPVMWVVVTHDGKDGWVDWKSLTKEGLQRSRKTGREWTEDDFRTASEKVIGWTIGATALLMSKEVETQAIAAPDKLNREREKKGRGPIAERYVVKIRPEARASQSAAAESLRSSPRTHWRRGHFRRLREDLVIPIAPTIVNAAEGMKPQIKKYQIGATS